MRCAESGASSSTRGSISPSWTTTSAILSAAKRPLLMIGRVSRDEAAWHARVALAEALNAGVVTDLKVGAAFPTDHPLHESAPGIYIDGDAARAIRDADAILRAAGRGVWRTDSIVSTADHNTPTTDWNLGIEGIADPIAREQIVTLDRQLLTQRVRALPGTTMRNVDDGLRLVLGL